MIIDEFQKVAKNVFVGIIGTSGKQAKMRSL